jgi:5'-nucleotidase
MKILLTNDDGIHAPGIEALHAAIQSLGEVVTIAPSDVQSATSHGITFHKPLMVEEVAPNARMRGYAVDGRPADCVKLGLRRIWPDLFGDGSRPDVVISGMNSGANVGINVIYSGTVAAAVESAFLGVPAIAVSLHLSGGVPHWRRAAEIARHAIDRVLEHTIDAHSVININIPRTNSADAPLPPMRVVSMNTAAGIDGYEKRVAPGGQVYYWPSGNGMEFLHTREGTDVEALYERMITVTPLQYDLTDGARMNQWRTRLGHGA